MFTKLMSGRKQTAQVSSPTGSASNAQKAAQTLEGRGFRFDAIGTKKQLQVFALDFATEWNSFIEQASAISGDADLSHKAHADALKTLLRVMKGRCAGGEAAFRDALVQALKDALGDFCVGTSKKRRKGTSQTTSQTTPVKALSIRLQTRDGESDVGFAIEVNRASHMNFGDHYGMAKTSRSDIACVVVRKDGIFDTTAVVELKFSDKSCKEYSYNSIPRLASESWHAPFAQAMFYAVDAFHSCAREGHRLEEIPVLSFSGKNGKEVLTDRLCCMEGTLKVPTELGRSFFYRVDRCIKFPSTGAEDHVYAQALAVFVKTLRIGLTHARALQEKIKNDDDAVTLCCSAPDRRLRLVASPIPGSKRSIWNINQGELHKFETDVSLKEWVRQLNRGWEHLIFGAEDMNLKGCLVKVSFKAVHNFLIPPGTSWVCLQRIHSTQQETRAARRLASVLLACAHNEMSGCLVMIMKDLTLYSSPGPRVPVPVPPFVETRPGWQSFERLVDDLLLPLARVYVIHNDIRCDPDNAQICNVLCVHGDPAELMVIDFESLSLYVKGMDVPEHPYAVSATSFGPDGSALQVLFWQVLWVAYVWHPATTKENLATASKFMEFFSPTETMFDHFKRSVPWDFIKASWERLEVSWGKVDNAWVELDAGSREALLRECKDECASEIMKTVRALYVAFPKAV